jgi:hypothetical protein
MLVGKPLPVRLSTGYTSDVCGHVRITESTPAAYGRDMQASVWCDSLARWNCSSLPHQSQSLACSMRGNEST